MSPTGPSATPSRASWPTSVSSVPALLDSLVRDALDPAYREAARHHGQRTSTPPASRRPARRRLHRGVGAGATVLLLAAGVVTGLVVSAQRRAAPAVSTTRTALAGDVRTRTDTLDALAAQLNQLQQQVNDLQARQLAATQTGQTLASAQQQLQLATGLTPVSGAGVVVTLADAAGTGPSAAAGSRPKTETQQGRVGDRDLQEVVNALWAAGAEAISVNDIRLSAQTAIRTAGATILVSYRPVTSPYLVRAVGDPQRIAAALVASATWQRLAAAASTLGLTLSVERADRLDLPAAATPTLRTAGVAGSPR